MPRKRSWGPLGGSSSNFDGNRGILSTSIEDGYQVQVTLERNEDGRLVCSGLYINYTASQSAPSVPISSRFLQTLGLGEMLKEARAAYVDAGEVNNEMTHRRMKVIDEEIKDWTLPGSVGFEDKKYAALAYLYQEQIMVGNESPIAYLSELMKCDRETASSRVVEARKRGLLTKPKHGNVGGVLTKAGRKALEME